MANNTFQENITIIRTTGVTGPEMREAIAEALEQAGDNMDTILARDRSLINQAVENAISSMNSIVSSAEASMDSEISAAEGRMNSAVSVTRTEISSEVSAIEYKVDTRNLYLQADQIGSTDEYQLKFINPN